MVEFLSLKLLKNYATVQLKLLNKIKIPHLAQILIRLNVKLFQRITFLLSLKRFLTYYSSIKIFAISVFYLFL